MRVLLGGGACDFISEYSEADFHCNCAESDAEYYVVCPDSVSYFWNFGSNLMCVTV